MKHLNISIPINNDRVTEKTNELFKNADRSKTVTYNSHVQHKVMKNVLAIRVL